MDQSLEPDCVDYASDKAVGEAMTELMMLPPTRELDLPKKAGGPARRLKMKLGLEHV